MIVVFEVPRNLLSSHTFCDGAFLALFRSCPSILEYSYSLLFVDIFVLIQSARLKVVVKDCQRFVANKHIALAYHQRLFLLNH